MSIGSELTAARERAGMTIEQVSAATRIRPGLLVAMEADDFSRCGGDFYARGHIRAIARAVKADPAPLLAAFEESHPEVDPGHGRQEDGPELRTPTLHPARPRWAVVVGAILVGLLGWGMVRLFTLPNDIEANASRTTPPPTIVTTPTPTTAKPVTKPSTSPKTPAKTKIVLTLKGARDGSYVTLRNYYGERLFEGLLGTGTTQTVTYPGSIRVSVTNVSNLAFYVNGQRVYPKMKRFIITPTGTLQKTS